MKRETSFRHRLAILGMVFALVASACGGSSDDAAEAVDDVAVEETEEVETEAEESGETEDADTDAAAEEPEEAEPVEETDVEETEEADEEPTDEADDRVIPAEYEALCEAATTLEVETNAISDPVAGFSLIAEAYVDFAELSPLPALSEDLLLMAEVSEQFSEILTDPDVDIFDPNDPAILELDALSTPEVEAAADRVDLTLNEVCGTGDAPLVQEVLGETIALDGPGEFTGSLEFATYDEYEIDVPEGTALTVSMADPTGFGIDTLLTIIDPSGAEFTNDDVSGVDVGDLGSFDSRIVIDEAVGGVYTIEAHSYQGEGEGDFVLNVTFG